MQTSTTATVIPLQRAETDLPRRPDTHGHPFPPESDTAYWEAEIEAQWAGAVLASHGRRCGCGCRPQPSTVDVAS